MSELLKNRYDFLFFFDVKDGNPNGDPDAGGLPRMDSQTGEGLVSDVCLKRKIRNYIQQTRAGVPGYDIFVKSKDFSGVETVLNAEIRKCYETLGIDLRAKVDRDGHKRKTEDFGKATGSEIKCGRDWMCAKFYDVRTFGAVMSTGQNAGQVRGPVQLTFARSLDSIDRHEHSISVSAARDENKPYEAQVGIQGRKSTVPYALYAVSGFVSPSLAAQTKFTEEDFELFLEALMNMFELDRSASHGVMTSRKLYLFKHSNLFGNAPAYKLFELVHAKKKSAVAFPRHFEDYDISIDASELPEGVKLIMR